MYIPMRGDSNSSVSLIITVDAQCDYDFNTYLPGVDNKR